MMNIKPGTLCVVTGAFNYDNLGKGVEAVRLFVIGDTLPNGDVYMGLIGEVVWLVKGDVSTWLGDGLGLIKPQWLRPIGDRSIVKEIQRELSYES